MPATGAYNASMASNYNQLPRPAAVMVSDGQARLVQRRETIEDLLAREVCPHWVERRCRAPSLHALPRRDAPVTLGGGFPVTDMQQAP